MNEMAVNEKKRRGETSRQASVCQSDGCGGDLGGPLVRWAPASPSPPSRSEFHVESHAANLLCHS